MDFIRLEKTYSPKQKDQKLKIRRKNMKLSKVRKWFSVILTLILIMNLFFPKRVLAKEQEALPTDEITITVGETTTLKSPGWSFNTTWESSDVKIAKVSNRGVVVGIAVGNAKIKAVSKKLFGGSIQKEFSVKVVEQETAEAVRIKIGETTSLSVPDKNGKTTWKSENDNIATVSSEGVVTGVSEGTVSVIAQTKSGGHKFLFWSWGETTTSKTYTIIVEKDSESDKKSYTVKFESNGEVIREEQVEEGDKVKRPDDPVRAGYVFKGWYTDKECTKEYDFDEIVSDEVVLYAKWENAKANSYIVEFESNGGSAVEKQQIEAGDKVQKPDDPTKEGYYFVAWYSDQDLTEVYNFDAKVTSDMILYAKWNEVPETEKGFIDEGNPEIEIYSFDTDKYDILVDKPESVTFTAEIFSENKIADNKVAVIDESNNIVGYMNDAGESGDEIADDGIYTLKTELMSPEEKVVSYLVSVENVKSYEVSISYYREHSDEEFQMEDIVSNQINEVVNKYLDEDGYLIVENYDEAIEAISNKLTELIEMGDVSEYTHTGNDFSIKLSNGISFIYTVLVDDGNDEGIGSGTVATFQPFKNTYNNSNNNLSDNATDGMAEKIRNEFTDYTWTANQDLEDVNLENLKNLANYSIILWHGHGGYDSKWGSMLAIGEMINPTTSASYNADISAGRIIPVNAAKRNIYAITGGYIQKYIGNMDGSFIYLAACDSGLDMINNVSERYNLVQECINKGAVAVVANSETICTKYNTEMEKDVIEEMCKVNSDTVNYSTLLQALQNAFSKNGEYCCEKYKAHPIIFPENTKSAQNYRLGKNEVGTLSGSVKDASSSKNVSNALVRVYDTEGNLVTSCRTDANGMYTFSLSTGEYVVRVSAGSYKSIKSSVTITSNTTTYNEVLLMISNGFSAGYVNGTITNAVTKENVPNVDLKFRKNWNNKLGEVVYEANTNEHGFYEVNSNDLPIGFYTMEMIKSGYVVGYKNIFVSPLDVEAQNAVLSPVTSDNTFRMVLTWGDDPRDLDSHIVGKLKDGNAFHVYYNHKSQTDDDTQIANLDVDDVDGCGPETITLIPNVSNPYYYYIYKYAGTGTLSVSNAQIKLYRGDTLIGTYNVPTDQGEAEYWNVFAIVNGEVIIKNTITSSADTSYAD